jgi:hypothetical protein
MSMALLSWSSVPFPSSAHEGTEGALRIFRKKWREKVEGGMAVLITCLTMGFIIAVSQNIPEIRDTLKDRNGHPYIGTASYLATASFSYGLILWLLAIAALGLSELMK